MGKIIQDGCLSELTSTTKFGTAFTTDKVGFSYRTFSLTSTDSNQSLKLACEYQILSVRRHWNFKLQLQPDLRHVRYRLHQTIELENLTCFQPAKIIEADFLKFIVIRTKKFAN